MKNEIITGLDIGSTKVCAVIAEKTGKNKFKILGVGKAPSTGLVRGEVSNIIDTANSIKAALNEAEEQAGVKVTEVIAGVSGENISSIRSRNYVTITNEEQEVTMADLRKLKEDMRSIQFSKDMKILHILHEEFFVDRQGVVTNPLGVACSRIEASNHVVMASGTAIQNIQKSVKRGGYEVGDLKLQSLASASAVLEDAEKDLGVLLLDIGGGTTDVLIYQGNAIRYSRVYGIAGNRITNDIKETLNVIAEDAEQLKTNYGYATEAAIVKDDTITVKGVGPRPSTRIPISLLTQIIRSRVEELFEIINIELEKSDVKKKIRAGLVITGGGALLKGITDLAEKVFGVPARVGLPAEEHFDGSIGELSKPEYATALGLLLPLEEDYLVDSEEEEKPKGTFWRRGKSTDKTKSEKSESKKSKSKSSPIKDFLLKIRAQYDDL